ncbi:MAG: mevalonate kinase family protein, partial [Anaerolineales bacterium]
EKLLHGTPSGIDNTVIAYEQPVYFVKGQPPEVFTVAQPFHLLIADTGIRSPTKITVGDVRAAWRREPERYEQMFRAIGEIVREAREIMESNISRLLPTSGAPQGCFANVGLLVGALMTRNHALLREMDVSSPELDALAESALDAGALGAKLSGGGRGGNLIALVTPETEGAVRAALERAGAKRVIGTVVGA